MVSNGCKKRGMLLVPTVMLVFLVAAVYNAQAAVLTGLVTRNGMPCPNARVVLKDALVLDPKPTISVLTDANGYYYFDNLIRDYFYLLAVNAVDAVAQKDILVNTNEDYVIRNIDLVYGIITPPYDDFSGSSDELIYDSFTNPDGKWEYLDTERYTGTTYTVTDLSSTSATIENGIVKINPYPKKGGIRSKDPMPAVATYEFTFPQRCLGIDNFPCQGFAIIKNTVSGHHNIIEIQDQKKPSAAPQLNVIVEGVKSPNITPGSYPVKVKIVRTYDWFDVYINGSLSYSAVNSNILDDAYIYLYGHEEVEVELLPGYNVGLPTFAFPTFAYFDDIRVGIVEPYNPLKISDVKSSDSGRIVTVPDVIVTASFADAFWVENPDRSAGIKVISNAKPAVGSKVLINGKLVKDNREAAIELFDMLSEPGSTVPSPVAITGKTAGELDKAGAAAQGLLVKSAGKITEVVKDATDTYVLGYYLDDGSSLTIGEHKGIYVMVDPSFNLPASQVDVGQFRVAVGPLTVYVVDEHPHPAIMATQP